MTYKIIIVVVIVLVITIIASLFLLQSTPSDKTPLVVTSTIAPAEPTSAFYVSSIFPQGDQTNKISIIASVQINFNEPLKEGSFTYKISPQVETNINFAPNSVIITPKISWPMGQEITITIMSAQNNDGVSISSPYIIRMQVPVPEGE